MSGLFGKATTPPAGFADAPNPNPAPPVVNQPQQGQPQQGQPQQGGEEGHFTPQTGMPQQQQQGVPAFEGAESGNVTEATPANPGQVQTQPPGQVQTQQPPAWRDVSGQPHTQQPGQVQTQTQQPPGQVQTQQPPQTQQQPPAQVQTQQPPQQMDAVALEARSAALDAREAKVIAEEARLAATGQNGGNPEQETETPSLLADIDEASLESEGERAIFKVAQGLENQLSEVTKQSQAAQRAADAMRTEQIIQNAMSQYGVTREELDRAYQETRNPDVNLLAQSILWQKGEAAKAEAQTQQGQQIQQQAHQARVQAASHITAAPGAQGANRTHTPPAGRGVTNPFDGEQVARAYRAFAP